MRLLMTWLTADSTNEVEDDLAGESAFPVVRDGRGVGGEVAAELADRLCQLARLDADVGDVGGEVVDAGARPRPPALIYTPTAFRSLPPTVCPALPGYAGRLFGLLRPGGRLLNHGIASPGEAVFRPNPFVARYVFPDGELTEVGRLVSVLHRAGFEVRHVEGLREHYPLTLRAWVHNLEDRWDDAALGFEEGALHIHQVLAVRPTARGSSGFPLRPDWEPAAAHPAETTPR